MIEYIELPTNRFRQNRLENLKSKNFIFGKNGTGKSSIVTCIEEQYSEEYDVRVFQGYERIVAEQGQLNSIALGTENVALQPRIEEAEAVVRKLQTELGNENSGLYKALNDQYAKVKTIKDDFDKFFSDSARKLKYEHPELVGITYNKIGFKRDISLRKKVSDKELNNAETNINQNIVQTGTIVEYTCESLSPYIESVNQLLAVDIIEPTSLSFNSDVERNWVQSGISLHENIGTCLFCGADLLLERKELLRDYFNDSVKEINHAIISLLNEIKHLKIKVKNMNDIDESCFLTMYNLRVKDLNLQLSKIRENKLCILDVLETKLKEKQNNIFSIVKQVEISDNNNDFEAFGEEYRKLYDENYCANNEVENIKIHARNVLLADIIFQICDSYGYSNKIAVLLSEEADLSHKENYISEKEQSLKEAQERVSFLKRQTVDETIAADTINRLLAGLGNKSFTLVKSSSDDQNGSYIIHDYNGSVRDIKSLSTGEKNIVAFLWFVSNLENLVLAESKSQVVIFDDPMNSNDDTTQYLIISELQKLIKANNGKQIFLLTHNVHFYLNTRYNYWKNSPSKKCTYHLIKNGTHTDIKLISDEVQDLKTAYDALWRELKWLFDNEEAKPEYLLNPIRRIIETFEKFNCINNMCRNFSEAEKLFDVNSHSIDDLDAELNGKDKVAIIEILKNVFSDNHASEHFNSHWKQTL